MSKRKIAGLKLQSILDQLLQGKPRKQIEVDEDVSSPTLSEIAGKYPLFFGLTRKYDKSS